MHNLQVIVTRPTRRHNVGEAGGGGGRGARALINHRVTFRFIFRIPSVWTNVLKMRNHSATLLNELGDFITLAPYIYSNKFLPNEAKKNQQNNWYIKIPGVVGGTQEVHQRGGLRLTSCVPGLFDNKTPRDACDVDESLVARCWHYHMSTLIIAM